VLFMSMGILLFTLLILLRLRNRFFPRIPPWVMYLTMIAVALGNPLLWLLNRPMVYEAAIVCGQFFFLAGLYFILPALYSAHRSAARNALAALCWALAAGSRITLFGGVGVLALAATWFLLRASLSRLDLTRKIISLWAPLILGAVVLFGYNYVRFGNVLESGFRYQFTDNDYTQESNTVFSLWNVPLNLYNYLGRQVSLHRTFPFIKPVEGKTTYHPLPVLHPSLYYSEPVTGLPLTTPFLFCALGLCMASAVNHKPRVREKNILKWMKDGGDPESQTPFLWWTLFGAGVAIVVPLILYWYCSERFILDFVMVFLLLAACGAWEALVHFRELGRRGTIVAGLILVSAGWTILVSLLLGVTGYGSHW